MITSGYGPRTAWHVCIHMVWLNDSQDSTGTPCDASTGTHGARTGIVRAPHGNLQCFSYPTGPVQGPCATRKGAVRRPYRHVRELTQPQLAKIPHGSHIWLCGARTGPLRSSHGLFTGCLYYQNPYGPRKLIMHALKLYGPRTGRQNSYGAVFYLSNMMQKTIFLEMCIYWMVNTLSLPAFHWQIYINIFHIYW